ncbi:hypothetical protein MMC26_004417 [Xylographa opegraphella]|nr:hypothetical protein [Xylographa opegraphella]
MTNPAPPTAAQQEALLQDLRARLNAELLNKHAALLQRLDETLSGLKPKTEAPDPQQLALLLQRMGDRLPPAETATSKTQFVWNAVLQGIALVIGVLFGVFAILSYVVSETANGQSMAANQLALLALCLASPNASTTQDACEVVFEQASALLASLATAAFGPLPTGSSTPSAGFGGPHEGSLSTGAIAGIAVGVVSLLSALATSCISLRVWRQKQRSYLGSD